MKLMWQRPVILLISSYPSIDEAGALYSEECNMLLDTVRKAAAKRHHIRLVHLHNPKNLQEIEKKIQQYRKRLLFVHYVGHSQQKIASDAYGVERPELHFDFGAYQPLRQKLQHIQENALLSKYIPLQGVFLHSCASDITGHSRANFPEIVTNRKVFDAQVAKHAQKFYRTLLWDGLPVDKAFAHSLAKEAAVEEGVGVARAFRVVTVTEEDTSAYRLKLPAEWQNYQLSASIWLPFWLYRSLSFLLLTAFIALLAIFIANSDFQDSADKQSNRNIQVTLVNDSPCSPYNRKIIEYFKNYAQWGIDAAYSYTPYNAIKNILTVPKRFGQVLFRSGLACGLPHMSFDDVVNYAQEQKIDILLTLHIPRALQENCATADEEFAIHSSLYIAADISGAEFISIKALRDAMQNDVFYISCQAGILTEASLKNYVQDIFHVKLKAILEFIALQDKLEQKLNQSTTRADFSSIFAEMLGIFADYEAKARAFCQSDVITYSGCSAEELPAEYSYLAYYVSGVIYAYLYHGYDNLIIPCNDVGDTELKICADALVAKIAKENPDFPRLNIIRSNQLITETVQKFQQNPHAHKETPNACYDFHRAIALLEELVYDEDISADVRYKAQFNIIFWHDFVSQANYQQLDYITQQGLIHETCLTGDDIAPIKSYPLMYERNEGYCIGSDNAVPVILLTQNISVRRQRFLCWLELIAQDYTQGNYEKDISTRFAIRVYEYIGRTYTQLQHKELGAYFKSVAAYQNALDLTEILAEISPSAEKFIHLKQAQLSLELVDLSVDCQHIRKSEEILEYIAYLETKPMLYISQYKVKLANEVSQFMHCLAILERE